MTAIVLLASLHMRPEENEPASTSKDNISYVWGVRLVELLLYCIQIGLRAKGYV